MRIGIQQATLTALDWTWIDSTDWAGLPDKGLPTNQSVVDESAGWYNAINVQGIIFSADHYAVYDVDKDTTVVVVWNDDPSYYPVGERFAMVRTFRTLAPDAMLGNAINTNIDTTIYCDEGKKLWDLWTKDPLERTTFVDYKQFVPPDASIVRHGIWVDDEKYLELVDALSVTSWREWTDGVDEKYVVDGKVASMRDLGLYLVPDGTKTYYHNGTNLNNGVYTASNENELGTSAAGLAQEIEAVDAGTDELAWCATTASGEPGASQWPTGNYRAQIDVSELGANISLGLRTAGGSSGKFSRVNSSLSSELESKTQQESLFTTTGLKLATTGSVSWSSGSDTDRFCIVIAASRPASHGSQSITLNLGETDDFADGPWVAATTVSEPLFMGMNF